MPLWDLVPAVADGDVITTDDGLWITDDAGNILIWDAGWKLIAAEVDDAPFS